MKFGKVFASEQLPQFQPHYLSYKHLKRQLQCKDESEIETLDLTVDKTTWYSTSFGAMFHREVAAVCAYVTVKIQELQRRRGDLVCLCNSILYQWKECPRQAKQLFLDWNTDIQDTISMFINDCHSLEAFSMLNLISIRKICKNYIKIYKNRKEKTVEESLEFPQRLGPLLTTHYRVLLLPEDVIGGCVNDVTALKTDIETFMTTIDKNDIEMSPSGPSLSSSFSRQHLWIVGVYTAICERDTVKLKELMTETDSVDLSLISSPLPLLHKSIKLNYVDGVSILLSTTPLTQMLLNDIDSQGRSPLMIALLLCVMETDDPNISITPSNPYSIISLLLSYDINLLSESLTNDLAIHFAIASPPDALALLLSPPISSTTITAQLHHRNGNGETPCHLACSQHKTEHLSILLSSVEANEEMATLWMECVKIAAKDCHQLILNVLLNFHHPSFIIHPSSSIIHHPSSTIATSYSALHLACLNLKTSTNDTLTSFIICLSQCYSSLNLKNWYLETPLHIACSGHNLTLVAVLLSLSASDINAQTKQGYTCLHVAVRSHSLGVIKLLLDYDADITIEDINGWTALSHALYQGDMDTAQCLITTSTYQSSLQQMTFDRLFTVKKQRELCSPSPPPSSTVLHEGEELRVSFGCCRMTPVTVTPSSMFLREFYPSVSFTEAFCHHPLSIIRHPSSIIHHPSLSQHTHVQVVVTLHIQSPQCPLIQLSQSSVVPFRICNSLDHCSVPISDSTRLSLGIKEHQLLQVKHLLKFRYKNRTSISQSSPSPSPSPSPSIVESPNAQLSLAINIYMLSSRSLSSTLASSTHHIASGFIPSSAFDSDSHGAVQCMLMAVNHPSSIIHHSSSIPQEPIGSCALTFAILRHWRQKHGLYDTPAPLYWRNDARICGHRGSGAEAASRPILYTTPTNLSYSIHRSHIKENTVLAFTSAFSAGAHYVEFDVQLTKDMIPVIYHNWEMVDDEGVFRVPIAHMTYVQFLALHKKNFEKLNFSISKSNSSSNFGILRRSSSEPSIMTMKVSDNLPDNHCQDSKEYGGGRHVFQGLMDYNRSLMDAFIHTPSTLGFNIEIKYPDMMDAREHRYCAVEVNDYVDAILDVVFRYGNDRPIFFSTFATEVAVALQLKQRRYPVLLLSESGGTSHIDIRRDSLARAVQMCQSEGFTGIVSRELPLTLDTRLIQQIKKQGLMLLTWGPTNNQLLTVQQQLQAGVDCIITDHLRYIASHIKQ